MMQKLRGKPMNSPMRNSTLDVAPCAVCGARHAALAVAAERVVLVDCLECSHVGAARIIPDAAREALAPEMARSAPSAASEAIAREIEGALAEWNAGVPMFVSDRAWFAVSLTRH